MDDALLAIALRHRRGPGHPWRQSLQWSRVSAPRKNRKTSRRRASASSAPPPVPPAPDSNPEWEQFAIQFAGFVAEADLRGMSPLAVFFEWLDDLQAADPERAAALLASLPMETRSAFREWRGGGSRR